MTPDATTQDEDTLFGNEDKPEQKKNDSEVAGRYKLSPVYLTVFKRENDHGTFFEFNLQRAYPKDEQANEFGYTNNMRPQDLRKASRLLERAADDIQGLEKTGGGQ